MLKLGIFLHHTVGSRSPGQNLGSLAAPTEALARAHILLVPSQTAFTGYSKGIFVNAGC